MATQSNDAISLNVLESLKGGPYACSSLAQLSGGTANFVYRGTLMIPLEDGSETVVIKHTEGYVATNPNFKLTRARCDFEQTILTSLHDFPPAVFKSVTVQTPRLYQFSSDTFTQVYSDLPSSVDLKNYALTHPLTQAQCSRLGHALGIWAKKFHSWTIDPTQERLVETMGKNGEMRELKYQINYTYLVATIGNFPEILESSRDIFEAVAKDVRESLDSGNGRLIHGDFWSGNVLLPNSSLSAAESPLRVFVIDWELSHVSSLAFDLGQMFAELFELKHFKDIDAGVWLIESFMGGYGRIDEDLAFKIAIHVGVHLVCWGSRVRGWGTKEQVESVVEIGRGFVVSGWKRDRKFLEGTPLKCLFS